MGLNILAELDQLTEKGIQFRGAILLTYSLNLQFFEQLVQPKLEALGCVNVVIISDQFGYQEALTHNLQRINGVGRQYVCVPVSSDGRGVQHSKILMLLSEQHGWMLMGSGNLTFSGYGQNLELFDQFEFDNSSTPIEAAYPFQTAWHIIESLKPTLTQTAQTQLTLLSKGISWLMMPPRASSDLEVWHSFSAPLSDHLFALEPVHELQLIAPFIDPSTVQRLLERFSPTKLVIGVDDDRRHLDGQAIERFCKLRGCELEVHGLRARTETSEPYRGLHAKVIIGIGKAGSWCIVGSANITRPALLDHWKSQGNLETVVFRTSSSPRAFDALWQSEVSHHRLPITSLFSISEPITSAITYGVNLFNLTFRDRTLKGSITFDSSLSVQEIVLDLILTGQSYSIAPDQAENFSVWASISGTEAATATVVCQDGMQFTSAKAFIDYPAELDRYGARAFHRAMRSKLELISNAAYMFRDLMEFLAQRIQPDTLTRETITQQRRTERHQSLQGQSGDVPSEVLPVSAFITQEELSDGIGLRVDGLNPYDRDHYSLRDLLSLALLRLTAETSSSSTQQLSIEEAAADEAAINIEIEEQRNTQRTWQSWLVGYLLKYCKQYNQQLQNPEFVRNTETLLLFQNHHTLSRVLIEFYEHEKIEIFTVSLLRDMIRLLWSPIFQSHDLFQSDENKLIWKDEQLAQIFVTMMVLGWPQSPSTRDTTSQIQRFLYARHLIAHAEGCVGKAFWKTLPVDDSLSENRNEGNTQLYHLGIRPLTHEMIRRFSNLARYRTPIEQRYDLCFKLIRLRKRNAGQSDEARAIEQALREKYPDDWKLAERAIDILPVVGSDRNCPIRNIELSDSVLARLRSGSLASSEHPRGGKVLLYWMPELDEQNVVL